MKQYELSGRCEKYQQIDILDLLCGRMSPEHSAVTGEEISRPSCKPFPKSGAVDQDGKAIPTKGYKMKRKEFLFLDLRRGGAVEYFRVHRGRWLEPCVACL